MLRSGPVKQLPLLGELTPHPPGGLNSPSPTFDQGVRGQSMRLFDCRSTHGNQRPSIKKNRIALSDTSRHIPVLSHGSFRHKPPASSLPPFDTENQRPDLGPRPVNNSRDARLARSAHAAETRCSGKFQCVLVALNRMRLACFQLPEQTPRLGGSDKKTNMPFLLLLRKAFLSLQV